MTHRCNADFVLASLLTGYPDGHFAEDMRALLEEPEAAMPAELRQKMAGIAGDPRALDDLRSEYLALFDSGRGTAPLYQTEYGRERAYFKAHELARLSSFYHAFGFELGGEGAAREMPDHLSVQLEFYALLRMKEDHLREAGSAEGVDIVRSAREKFLREHLGRFVPAVLERPGIDASGLYGPILRFCRDLVRAECEALAVAPEKLSWVDGEQEPAEMACGSFGCAAGAGGREPKGGKACSG